MDCKLFESLKRRAALLLTSNAPRQGILLDRGTLDTRRENVQLRQEVNARVLSFLILSFISVAQADDFKTVTGKEYKDATVSRVEPDGIVLTNKAGIYKIYFTELPKDVQERFGYDPQRAADYSAQQSAGFEQVRKQQEETLRQKEEATQKANQSRAQQQSRQNQIQTLQARYEGLQRQEDDLLLRIGEAKKPGPAYFGGKNNKTLRHSPNPQASQLPLLQSHLKDVRHEKDQVRKQLEKAQR
jgi:hypothetical protein